MKIKDSDIAYKKIKEKIILTDLKPGEKIIENKLMEEFKLGRTPIREALTKLSYEGFILIKPRKGMFISEINLKDLNKTLALRLELIHYISREAIKYTTMEDINHIIDLKEKNSKLERNYINSILIDLDFHLIIYKLCRNNFLEEIMTKMLYLSARMLVYKNERNDIDRTLSDYDKLVEYIKDKDSKKLEDLLRYHILDLEDSI